LKSFVYKNHALNQIQYHTTTSVLARAVLQEAAECCLNNQCLKVKCQLAAAS
jgi:hypothetical protein